MRRGLLDLPSVSIQPGGTRVHSCVQDAEDQHAVLASAVVCDMASGVGLPDAATKEMRRAADVGGVRNAAALSVGFGQIAGGLFAPPAAELIQYEMPERIAATGRTATGSMIDLPSRWKNFMGELHPEERAVVIDGP